MSLVLYSGGDDHENIKIDHCFLELLAKKNPVVTFIPSSSYLSDQEFKAFVKHYAKFKIKRFIHFAVDVPFDKILYQEVMKSDAIYLAGGNTFYFLHGLRKAKLLGPLKKFVQRGGVLAGLSAGAILMNEHIDMASYPDFDRDDNFVKIKNFNSLNLVDFLFFPHFKNSPRYDEVLQKYTKKSDKIIYACPDGSGIIVREEETRFIGKCFVFIKGNKFSIH